MFDDEGRHVGTVVTRETEWDDTERGKLLDLAEYEAGVHADGCGYHRSIGADPSNYFTVEDDHCLLCANLAREQRVRQASDDEEQKRLKDNPRARRKADGRRTYLRPLTPEEVETALQAKGVRGGGSS